MRIGCLSHSFGYRLRECDWISKSGWALGFKHVTAPTNVRSFIAALLPVAGFGNSLPILKPETRNCNEWLLAANFNATIFDFVARQKIQGQNLNLFVVEQLPIVPLDRYEATRFGPKTAAEIVRDAVLELTYTAHDMAPFARDLGYEGPALPMGRVPPPVSPRKIRRPFLPPLRPSPTAPISATSTPPFLSSSDRKQRRMTAISPAISASPG